MFKLNLKIALRNLWKNKLVTTINIGGLSVALAAFVLIVLYVGYETGYDSKLPHVERVYQVGRSLPEMKTPYTPPTLSEVIKNSVPEVELVGLVKKAGFDFAVSSAHNTFFTADYTMVDYDAARLFDLRPEGGLKKPDGETGALFYLPGAALQTLFPGKKDHKPAMVILGSKSAGFSGAVTGATLANPHSVLQYDALSIQNKLGAGEGYGHNNYFTYLRVKPGTDRAALQKKLTMLYRQELIRSGAHAQGTSVTSVSVFLDPLVNAHLKPAWGSNGPFKIVVALFTLGLLILLIACINFTNLSIAQATGRAKEVGIRKVMGAARYNLARQFVIEIFLQCLLASVLGLIIAELLLPKFNAVFQVPLVIRTLSTGLVWQFPLIIMFITLAAGGYPALVLSGFRPAAVLKGNFQTSRETTWLRKGLLVFQFAAAAVFIAALMIVTSQLRYMRTEDTGFRAEQVITIKNMAFFNEPHKFASIRNQLLTIPGVRSATVATDIPDGSKTGTARYSAEGRETSIDFVNVDFDYFETLSIPLVSGRTFSEKFGTDTADAAILNQSAVARYGLNDPIGKIIRGCEKTYRIVGVTKDLKAQGFEHAVQPTIYTINNPCSNPKTRILLKIDAAQMSAAISTLKMRWADINKLDGEHFRYHFLDELYGRLFEKQEQLQKVFVAASVLTVCIAMMGLFAYARYLIGSRNKEIAIRKVLGAGNLQLLQLLNSGFIALVLLANLLSWPLAYLLAQAWLDGFAYRISIPLYPFLFAGAATLLITIVTVTVQAWHSMKANPVAALKYE
ncbi:FtsX-like permease family protein [Pedobacter sp. SYP-B3415]|uniref:ABC transporter permease n=1 Tax=Pedobacter sp. SYP-B3415 TaxID=2496641 RepID=UPI00101B6ADF|nr:FtsX-like permease family protein [Pedobacter sp. SYP-B3415]